MHNLKPFTVQVTHGVTIVRVHDERVTFENADVLFDSIRAAIENTQPAFVVINLRKVQYLHSTALSQLVELRRSVMAYGGELRLCSLQPQAIETLHITRIDRLLTICESERSALAA